ncbi:MAG: hypothetical protein WCB68_06210 [Pyrinomonadaceae bacterium]
MATEEANEHSTSEQEENPSKAALQRHMEEKREAITQTVNEIKETVTEQYETVKETVGGVLDYREQFSKEPLLWSVGTLTAGFALGYTLGYAHKNTRGRKHSEIAAFADSIVDEISTVGQSLIMPTLNARIRELFGFDFSELLDEIGEAKKGEPKQIATKKRAPIKTRPKKGATKRVGAKKRSKK